MFVQALVAETCLSLPLTLKPQAVIQLNMAALGHGVGDYRAFRAFSLRRRDSVQLPPTL